MPFVASGAAISRAFGLVQFDGAVPESASIPCRARRTFVVDIRGAASGKSRLGNGWAHARFLTLAERLMSDGIHVIFTGTATERDSFAKWLDGHLEAPLLMDAMGKWTLEELMAVLGKVRAVVASSTGPLHLASALGTPVVGMYRSDAPFWPERWGPLGPSSVLSTKTTLPDGGLDLGVEEVHRALHDLLKA